VISRNQPKATRLRSPSRWGGLLGDRRPGRRRAGARHPR
jgi:hypothetical protein